MPKQKSSASTATRKKHARRAAARDEALAARAEREDGEIEGDEEQEGGDEEHGSVKETIENEVDAPVAPVVVPDVQPEPQQPAEAPRDSRGKRIKDVQPAQSGQRGQKSKKSDPSKDSTKKKHSKKHAKGQAPPPPRIKQYIPPKKPENTNVDPVDIHGLGVVGAAYERVPAERVVALRLLHKKDSLTVERGLDELLSWIASISGEQDEETRDIAVAQLSEALPVWIHHLPRMLTSASRRVRSLAATIQGNLLHLASPSLLEASRPILLAPVTLERDAYLSCQLCATFDADRQVRALSSANWTSLCTDVDLATYLEELVASLADDILEHPAAAFAQDRSRQKLSEDERIALQEETDRRTNHLASSIDALASLLHFASTDNEHLYGRVTSSETFWSFLSSSDMPAAHVRRAVWRFLGTLLSISFSLEHLDDVDAQLKHIVLASAFVERDYLTQNTMWEPLIVLLRRRPDFWQGGTSRSSKNATGDATASSSDNSDSDEDAAGSVDDSVNTVSPLVSSYFDMLQIGFFGNAVPGYNAAPLLIHTIPPNALPRTRQTLELLFSSYWAAYTGRAFAPATPPTIGAFVSTLVDLVRITLSLFEAHASISAEQLVRIWRYVTSADALPSKGLSLNTAVTSTALEKGLVALYPKEEALFETTWQPIADLSLKSCSREDNDKAFVTSTLVAWCRSQHIGLASRARNLMAQVLQAVLNPMDGTRPMAGSPVVLEVLRQNYSEVLEQIDIATVSSGNAGVSMHAEILRQAMTKFMGQHCGADSGLDIAYLRSRSGGDRNGGQEFWQTLTKTLQKALPERGLVILHPYLDELPSGNAAAAYTPNDGLESAIVQQLTTPKVASDDEASVAVTQRLLKSETALVTATFSTALAQSLIQHFEAVLQALLSQTEQPVRDAELSRQADLLKLLSSKCLNSCPTETPAFVTLFQCAYLAPRVTDQYPQTSAKLQQISRRLGEDPSPWRAEDLYVMVASTLHDYLVDEGCFIGATSLADAVLSLTHFLGASATSLSLAYLPDHNQVEQSARAAYSAAPAIQALTGRLSPARPNTHEKSASTSTTSFFRILTAWIAILSEYRSLVTHSEWLLEYLLLGEQILFDRRIVDASNGTSITDETQALEALCRRLAIYSASQVTSQQLETWHQDTVAALRQSSQPEPLSGMAETLRNLIDLSTESHYAQRALAQAIKMLIHQSGASGQDCEAWLALAKALQSTNMPSCISLVIGLKGSLHESAKLARYQGETAAALTSVKRNRLVADGQPLLTLLLALAQASGSDENLLPPNRAIFLLQAMQKWNVFEEDEASEDDSSPETLCPSIMSVCTQLVSIVQDLSGSHWDFMFDVAEYLIEDFSWEDGETWDGLHAACSFLAEIQSRASINKSFKTLVRQPAARNIKLLQPLIVAHTPASAVVDKIKGVMAHLLQSQKDLTPDSLVELVSSLELFSGHSLVTMFKLCEVVIGKRNDQMILASESRRDIETGDNEEPPMPIELFSKLGTPSAAAQVEHILHFYLHWLLVLQFFSDTTTTFKSQLTDQLRQTGLVASTLLPTIFAHVELSDRRSNVDLAGWTVDEYHLEDLENFSEQAVPPLAAHVYYQALRYIPSLIRTEWEGIRDKQLSSAVESFTSKFFSPLLIKQQLDRVDLSNTKDPLQDDTLTIKLLPAVNEVKATYIVDEQPMEMAVRIPSNFPLTPVEVRDIKRVGVPESVWRAWLLNVQVIISGQNGSIADALELFKTNATRHFDGVEACAICYSVISVTDRSMPTKRCRTCKQLFHPSCLYKWFSSSHGSSCPLCRSLF